MDNFNKTAFLLEFPVFARELPVFRLFPLKSAMFSLALTVFPLKVKESNTSCVENPSPDITTLF
ncbi:MULTISPECIES: hypothetical protein [Bartonella]|uniref:hypothetical protein n=1 Tax=Bartonella TaxID=773 RepID=UPI0018DE0BE5|nr:MULTISPECIES: hypothetical protein [Bartonella]MBH9974250.1 hypothetical protein [Bartonella choladocola]MBI0013857.1 hypothetical protein [Bartonella sp. B10834G3]